MAALLALLAQQGGSPSLQTRKALMVLGLQNDFILPDGKLSIEDISFVDRISTIVPEFREFGDVIWVKTVAEAQEGKSNLDFGDDSVIVTSRPQSSRRSADATPGNSSKRVKVCASLA